MQHALKELTVGNLRHIEYPIMGGLFDRVFPCNPQEVIAVVSQHSPTLAAGELKLDTVIKADIPRFGRSKSIVASLPEVLCQERVYVFIKVELDLAHRC